MCVALKDKDLEVSHRSVLLKMPALPAPMTGASINRLSLMEPAVVECLNNYKTLSETFLFTLHMRVGCFPKTALRCSINLLSESSLPCLHISWSRFGNEREA